MAARFETKRSKAGKTYHVITRAELEHAPGFRATGGDKARAACPFHGGDNPQALEIDFAAGTARCYTRGCFARIAEQADGYGAPLSHRERGVNRTNRTPQKSPPTSETLTKADISARARPNADALARLAGAFERARAALPGSPAVAYLARRGIPLALAQRLGLGWSATGTLRNRLIFPLGAPDGTITSASGRALGDETHPKYLNLGEKAGYVKGWFHAEAIARARETGAPVYVCEGVFDALALLAGGIDTATAIMGKHDPRLSRWLAQWVSGVPGVVFCPDEDDDGQGRAAYERAARALMIAVPAIVAPRGYLDGCNDLGEYWRVHRALPPVLAELAFPQHALGGFTYGPERDESPHDDAQYLDDPTLAPELAALLEPAWFTAPVPVESLSADAVRALARCGHPYDVTPAPLRPTPRMELPAACLGGLACEALGPCLRAPYCRLGDAPPLTEDCHHAPANAHAAP